MRKARHKPLGDFEAGVIFQSLQSAALGVKPVAAGVIRASSRRAFLAFARRSGFDSLCIGFGAIAAGQIEWRASRFRWAIDALAWLEADGSTALGGFHLHWVQGLLYGYGPDEIDRFLTRLSEPESSSRPSCPSRTAGTSRPSTGGSGPDLCWSRPGLS